MKKPIFSIFIFTCVCVIMIRISFCPRKKKIHLTLNINSLNWNCLRKKKRKKKDLNFYRIFFSHSLETMLIISDLGWMVLAVAAKHNKKKNSKCLLYQVSRARWTHVVVENVNIPFQCYVVQVVAAKVNVCIKFKRQKQEAICWKL
jgi:hypothetical protein